MNTNDQVNSEGFIEKFIYYNSEIYDEEQLYYIFADAIGEISGDGELLPHHEFSINYHEKFCIFNDFDVDFETNEQTYTNYKIILRQTQQSQQSAKKFSSSFNIFIFTKIDL